MTQIYWAAQIRQRDIFIGIHREDPKSGLGTYRNPWEPDGDFEPTKVGVAGQMELHPDLRSSKTCSRTYYMGFSEQDWLEFFFQDQKVDVGDGRKHVYEVGDFMKEHYDSHIKHPYSPLPHTFSMIITNDVSPLRICGQPIRNPIGGEAPVTDDTIWIVLFSLDCSHEVLPTSKLRISYTFPVFGKYCGLHLKPADETHNMHDLILEQIRKTDPSNTDEVAQLSGWIKMLRDDECLRKVAEIQAYNGLTMYHDGRPILHDISEYESSGTRVRIEYRDSKGEYCDHDLVDENFDEWHAPDGATDVYVSFYVPQRRALIGLESMVRGLADVDEAVSHVLIRRVTAEPTALKCDRTEMPHHPFVYKLIGRYLKSDTIDQLMAQDRSVYEFLLKKGRKVSFHPRSQDFDQFYRPDRDEPSFLRVMELQETSTGQVFQYVEHNDAVDVTGAGVEFDDQGGYDPQFIRVMAVFVVE